MDKQIVEQTEVTTTVDYSVDGCRLYRVFMKWDGCMDITKFFNGGEDEERLHICDANDFIEHIKTMEADRHTLIEAAE
jgi:hypothetical protein